MSLVGHSPHAPTGSAGGCIFFGNVRDQGFDRQDHGRDAGRVLDRAARDLGRVDDPLYDHVAVLVVDHVVAPVRVALFFLLATHRLDDDGPVHTGVGDDAAHRLLQGAPDDGDAGLRIGRVHLDVIQGGHGVDQRHAATGDDPFLDRRTGRAQGVLDAVLFFLQLDLGRRAHADDGDATGQLGQPLLELFLVIVRGRVLDLGADLVDAALDLLLVPCAADEGRVFLGRNDLVHTAQVLDRWSCPACGPVPR